jgi:outer membrane protein assembly factor BamB
VHRLTVLVCNVALLAAALPSTAIAATPTISGFLPASGPIGTSVTVSGTHLGGATKLRFNGRSAIIKSATATTVKGNVPAGASTGKISVTTSGGTATSGASFTVTRGIQLSRHVAPPTATIQVSGSGYVANGVVDLYFDTAHRGHVIADTRGTFLNASLTVPRSAAPGTHWISAIEHATSIGAKKPITVRTDWPQFHRTADKAGNNDLENVLSPSTASGLALAWTGATDGGTSSPAVARGVVYVASSGNLYAFAAGCGIGGGSCKALWIGPTGGGTSSSPAVANGVVYVGSADGKLYAFAADCGSSGATCTPLWTGTTADHSVLDSSPAVANGVVYVGAYNGWAGADKGVLYAFAVGCGSGGSTCTPLWTGATDAFILSSSPAVAKDVVYVGSRDYQGTLYAFAVGCASDGSACTPLWKGATSGRIYGSSPAVADGVVYVGSRAYGGPSNDGKLSAFAAGCGIGGAACTPIWTGAIGGGTGSSPAVADGVVYVGSDDGKLYAYAAGCGSGGAECTPLWTGPTGGAISSSPAVANGVVYVGSGDGHLYAFAVGCSTGGAACTSLWAGPAGGAVAASPAVANGVVYVGSTDGKVYAWDLAGTPTTARR